MDAGRTFPWRGSVACIVHGALGVSFVLDAVGVDASGEGFSLVGSGPGVLEVGLVVHVFAPAVEDVQGEGKFRAIGFDFKGFVDAVAVG